MVSIKQYNLQADTLQAPTFDCVWLHISMFLFHHEAP